MQYKITLDQAELRDAIRLYVKETTGLEVAQNGVTLGMSQKPVSGQDFVTATVACEQQPQP